MFTIAAPFDPDQAGTATGSLLAGGAYGQCTMDTFQVTGSGGASPVICGSNDGQHSEFTEYTLQMFTGNYGDLAGKICNIYGKGL